MPPRPDKWLPPIGTHLTSGPYYTDSPWGCTNCAPVPWFRPQKMFQSTALHVLHALANLRTGLYRPWFLFLCDCHHHAVPSPSQCLLSTVHLLYCWPWSGIDIRRTAKFLFPYLNLILCFLWCPTPTPGTKNSFQTLKMKLENITNPWSPSHSLVQPTLEQTQYSQEHQAAFRFGQTLPKYLLFSSPQKNCWGHRRSYRLQIHSMAEQVLPPGWQEERAVTWAR